jgi:hypothetical protein
MAIKYISLLRNTHFVPVGPPHSLHIQFDNSISWSALSSIQLLSAFSPGLSAGERSYTNNSYVPRGLTASRSHLGLDEKSQTFCWRELLR